MSSITGAIKCRKAFFGCIFCGEKIEVGQIYTKFQDEEHKKGNKVHRKCAFEYIGMEDPLLKNGN